MNKKITNNLEDLLIEYKLIFSKFRPSQRYEDISTPINEYDNLQENTGDEFFSKFGVGNNPICADRPFERARAYELLLQILHEYDNEQYLKIHKGTPYFFIGWTAFQHLDFENAFFYMDATVSEDIRKLKALNKPLTTKTPAIDFMLLNHQSHSVSLGVNIQLQTVITDILREFKKDCSIAEINTEDFIGLFIKPLLFHQDKKVRSLITALYCFFVEFESKRLLIQLRSSEGGSIEPLLNHLFKGARILESLLVLKGGNGNDLKSKVESLPILKVNTTNFKGDRNLISAHNIYESLKKGKASFQDCNFSASYIIRNTTGHSLIWADNFKTEDSYTILYMNLVNSILWSIYKLWIKNPLQP